MRNLAHSLLVVCLLASALCRAMPAAGNGLFCGASGTQANPILVARILASAPPELRPKAALTEDCCKLHCSSAALIPEHFSLRKFEALHLAVTSPLFRLHPFEARAARARGPPRFI